MDSVELEKDSSSVNVKMLWSLLKLLFLLSFFISSCKSGNNNLSFYNTYDFFDTVSSIYLYSDNSETIYNELYLLMEKYHKLLDIYNEYDGINNICTINKNAGIKPVKVDNDILDLISFCKKFCELTYGKVDISFGAVLSVWHDYRDKKILPDYSSLLDALKHTGFDKIEVDYNNGTVFITDENASIDVGAVSKGFVCEKLAEYLESNNISNCAINLGGNIKLIGKKGTDENWITGIKNPSDESNIIMKLSVSNLSIVTSGGYERFYELNGIKYHHIIDSETLFPAAFHDSVTIICENSEIADLLSTALFCMSVDDGKEVISVVKEVFKLNTLDAVWIKNGGINFTNGIENYETK